LSESYYGHGPTIYTALHSEVTGIGMVEDDGGDASLGSHHVAIGELDTDLFRLKGREQFPLHGEIGAGRIAKAVPIAPIARRKGVLERKLSRIGKTPGGPQTLMNELGCGLGRLQRQRR